MLVKSGITHLAMTPEAFGRRLPFLFLDDVAAAFQQRYSSVAAGATRAELLCSCCCCCCHVRRRMQRYRPRRGASPPQHACVPGLPPTPAGALAYEMNDGFRPTLAEAARRFSDPKADVLTRVRGEVRPLACGRLRGCVGARTVRKRPS